MQRRTPPTAFDAMGDRQGDPGTRLVNKSGDGVLYISYRMMSNRLRGADLIHDVTVSCNTSCLYPKLLCYLKCHCPS